MQTDWRGAMNGTLCVFHLFVQEICSQCLSLSLAIEPVRPHRQASFFPLHPSIFPLGPYCGQYLKHPSLQPSLLCPLLQDNYNCRMHDGSQEVPAGRTELHPGD